MHSETKVATLEALDAAAAEFTLLVADDLAEIASQLDGLKPLIAQAGPCPSHEFDNVDSAAKTRKTLDGLSPLVTESERVISTVGRLLEVAQANAKTIWEIRVRQQMVQDLHANQSAVVEKLIASVGDIEDRATIAIAGMLLRPGPTDKTRLREHKTRAQEAANMISETLSQEAWDKIGKGLLRRAELDQDELA